MVILFCSGDRVGGHPSGTGLQGNGIGSEILYLPVGGLFLKLYFFMIFVHDLQRLDSTCICAVKLSLVDDADLVSGDHAALAFQSGVGNVKNIGALVVQKGDAVSVKILQRPVDFIHIDAGAVGNRLLYSGIPGGCEPFQNSSGAAAGEKYGAGKEGAYDA